MGKTKYLSAFKRGMVVGARHTGSCQELQHCWVFHAQQFPMYIKNGPPAKGHPANLTTVGSVGVNMGQHPRGALSTHLSMLRRIQGVLRAKRGRGDVPNVWYILFLAFTT